MHTDAVHVDMEYLLAAFRTTVASVPNFQMPFGHSVSLVQLSYAPERDYEKKTQWKHRKRETEKSTKLGKARKRKLHSADSSTTARHYSAP